MISVEIDPPSKQTPETTKQRTILLAAVAGFCFGVRRAVQMTETARSTRTGPVTTLGSLVHNSQVIERLRTGGVGVEADLGQINEGTVVLSAHGSAPAVMRQAIERGLSVVDVTCPFVTKVHRSARALVEAGYDVLLLGDRGHTEVKGVIGAIEEIGGSIRVVSTPEEVATLALGKKVGVVCQTTQRRDKFAEIVAEVCKRVSDVRAINTVCNATEELQEAAIELARKCEVVIVIGGKQSANTRRLKELCQAQGARAHQIETVSDIDMAWVEEAHVVGVTAGASTPDWQIEEVARALNGGSLPEAWNLHHPDE
jgi:4-hydroxy-3-methylbut-2-enyl diphosphate reductase